MENRECFSHADNGSETKSKKTFSVSSFIKFVISTVCFLGIVSHVGDDASHEFSNFSDPNPELVIYSFRHHFLAFFIEIVDNLFSGISLEYNEK